MQRAVTLHALSVSNMIVMNKSVLFSIIAGLAIGSLSAQTVPADAGKKAKEAAAAAKNADPSKIAKAPAAKPADKVKLPPKAPTKNPRTPAEPALLAKAKTSAAKLNADQSAKLLALVQKGTLKEIEALPGVGKGIGANIIAARPIASVDDLVNVTGIGEDRFDGIISWAQGKGAESKPSAAKKPAAAPKATPTKDAGAKAAKGAADSGANAVKDGAAKAAKDAAGALKKPAASVTPPGLKP